MKNNNKELENIWIFLSVFGVLILVIFLLIVVLKNSSPTDGHWGCIEYRTNVSFEELTVLFIIYNNSKEEISFINITVMGKNYCPFDDNNNVLYVECESIKTICTKNAWIKNEN